MKKWAPQLVQSHASPAAKGLMVIMTEIWEKKSEAKPNIRTSLPRRRRPRWQKGGYGVYDLRMLRLFGEWIHQVEEAPP